MKHDPPEPECLHASRELDRLLDEAERDRAPLATVDLHRSAALARMLRLARKQRDTRTAGHMEFEGATVDQDTMAEQRARDDADLLRAGG